MKTMLTGVIIGLIIGGILTGAIIFFSSPSMMMKESKSNYDFETTVKELEKSIGNAGWKIPHVNDLQAIMKKFGKEVRKVQVYEICHPDLAYNILTQDDERIVSNMMPCRIAIYEKSDGQVYLSRLNAGLLSKPMSKIIRNTMSNAAAETEEIIEEIIVTSK